MNSVSGTVQSVLSTRSHWQLDILVKVKEKHFLRDRHVQFIFEDFLYRFFDLNSPIFWMDNSEGLSSPFTHNFAVIRYALH